MDPRPGGRIVLWACLLTSLFVHAIGLLTLADPRSVLARTLLVSEDEEEAPPDVRLGIDESQRVSIAWIGFTRETPHSGVKSETLQPQLSAEAAAVAFRAAQQAAASASAVRDSAFERLSVLSRLAARLEAAREAAALAKAAENPENADQPSPAQPNQPNKDAIPDDRESDATTPELTIRQHDLGRVVARQGLRIQTFRPDFDATTRQYELRARQIEARSRRVTAVIQFQKNGAVLMAQLKPGAATGVETIDGPILDSVYRWRATGTDLDALPDDPKATITVEIQILF